MSGRNGESAHRWRKAVAAGGVILAVLVTVAACGSRGLAAAPTTPIPATITLLTAKADFGTYLTDSSGRALYMWDDDREGTSNCYSDCAVDWPPLTVQSAATAGPGIQASLIGTVARKDGSKQVTYGGWPLYYYAPDTEPGELSGQGNTGFGAVWWVVAPDGTPLPSEK